MTYNPQRPARRSPRLKGYDYAQEGAYFVTICVQHRLPLFGAVQDGVMHLNDAGRMVAACWEGLPARFADVELDLYCVMPNHFHGIVLIIRPHQTGAHGSAPLQDGCGVGAEPGGSGAHGGTPLHDADVGADPRVRPHMSLSTVIQGFKSLTTHAYMRGVQEHDWGSFHGKLWQRSFHDHIIRSEESLNMLRAYTEQNPARWEADQFYG